MLKTTKTILVLGGTGYVGQRIVHRLHQEGHPIRVMTRRPHMAKAWLPNAQIITGDALSGDDLCNAMRGISHIIVCIRTADTIQPKEILPIALQILQSAKKMKVQHLVWLSALAPDMTPLKNILRSQDGLLSIFWLQSGPILSQGSLTETARYRLAKYPLWLTKTHQGQYAISIHALLNTLSRAITENKTGRFRLPKHAQSKQKTNTVSRMFWILVMRLPQKLGPWLYLQMEGTKAPRYTRNRDNQITWKEALTDPPLKTWSGIPLPRSSTITTWIRQIAPATEKKPGQYHHHFRLIYHNDNHSVWQSCFRYPFQIRITLTDHADITLLPTGFFGWFLGKGISGIWPNGR
jgi:hypothetical protein